MLSWLRYGHAASVQILTRIAWKYGRLGESWSAKLIIGRIVLLGKHDGSLRETVEQDQGLILGTLLRESSSVPQARDLHEHFDAGSV